MPYALGAIQVQAGKAYTIPVGSAGTVGAIVCANESPYAVNASISATGAPGQWIVAQTADLIACDVSGFNGTLTFTTDNYLSNASSAPSFLLYLTAFAPGEAIRGTYPAPLMRLANGAIGVATQLVNDGNTTGTRIIEATPGAEPQSYIIVNNDGTFNVYYKSPTLGIVQAFISGLTPDAQYGVGFQVGNGLAVFGASMLDGAAGQPIRTDGAGNISFVGNINSTGSISAAAPIALKTGHQETGAAGVVANAVGSNQPWGNGVNFKTICTNIPSSVTLTSAFTNNVASTQIDRINQYGFYWLAKSSAAGLLQWYGTYTTVGNCLLAVDLTARTFDHHCDNPTCGHISRAQPLSALTALKTEAGAAMSYICPQCGSTEHFNTRLSAADEADTAPQGSGEYATTRGAQATLIRQVMTALGLEVAS